MHITNENMDQLGSRIFRSTMNVIRMCVIIDRTRDYNINVLVELRNALLELFIYFNEYDEHDGEEQLSELVRRVYDVANSYEEQHLTPLIDCLNECHSQNGLVDGIERLIQQVARLQPDVFVRFERIFAERNE